MTSLISELIVAIAKLAAIQMRFGLMAAEVAAFGVQQTVSTEAMVPTEAGERPSSIEIDAAARAIKVKLLAGWEGSFRNVLRLNFPDDNIRAMAEAPLWPRVSHEIKLKLLEVARFRLKAFLAFLRFKARGNGIEFPELSKPIAEAARPMPWFHFNSCTGDVLLRDTEGEELPNLAAARDVAVASAREALAEAVKSGDTPPDHIQVTDRKGREVLIVPLAKVLKIKS